MPDLDQLLDTLVADVTAGTRAPGASSAIKQAQRRRATVAVASAGAVAFVAVVGALAAGTLGGSDRLSPIGEPTTPSPTTVQESAEPSPTSREAFATELDAILAQAPNWAVNPAAAPDLWVYDPTERGSCSGDWTRGAAVMGFDNDRDPDVVGGPSKGEVTFAYLEVHSSSPAGIAITGFPSEARASDAAARFVENLDSCTTTAWRTQPIAQTSAVLASTADGLAWIQQKGADLLVLAVPTTDGPPPVDVQVEVAEWMVAYNTSQNSD
jgi:hypothetical protein